MLRRVQLFVILWTMQSMEFSRQEYWNGYPFPSPGDLPNPGMERRSPALQANSLPPEPQGKPKTTGVGSLPLLQGIFPTQELNRGLLHCRRILYQMNYEGSPLVKNSPAKMQETTRDLGSIPGLGRSPGGGHEQLAPIFLPGESHGWRSLEATVYRVAKSWT